MKESTHNCVEPPVFDPADTPLAICPRGQNKEVRFSRGTQGDRRIFCIRIWQRNGKSAWPLKGRGVALWEEEIPALLMALGQTMATQRPALADRERAEDE